MKKYKLNKYIKELKSIAKSLLKKEVTNIKKKLGQYKKSPIQKY